MDDNQVVDQLTEGITPFQPEAQAITEVVTPAPEFTPAPVITPAEVANINQASEHQELTAENKLGEIAVTQAEQDQSEADELVQLAPALETYNKLSQLTSRLNKAKFKQLATVGVGATLAVGTAIVDRHFQLNGALDMAVRTGPMAVVGASVGGHKEILNNFVGNAEDLSRRQKVALKVGNAAAGAVIGAVAGEAVAVAAERTHDELLKPIVNGLDDAVLAGGSVAGVVRKQVGTIAGSIKR